MSNLCLCGATLLKVILSTNREARLQAIVQEESLAQSRPHLINIGMRAQCAPTRRCARLLLEYGIAGSQAM